MNSDTFANALRKLAPSKADLENFGLSEKEIISVIDSYRCTPRISSNNYKNPILDLVDRYDCSKVVIGLVSFLNGPIETQGYYEIGRVDIDVLVLNKINLKIEVRDHDSLEYVLWTCAPNSDAFLDSILSCAEFFTVPVKKPTMEHNQASISHMVDVCISKTSEECLEFYQMLLGYE